MYTRTKPQTNKNKQKTKQTEKQTKLTKLSKTHKSETYKNKRVCPTSQLSHKNPKMLKWVLYLILL